MNDRIGIDNEFISYKRNNGDKVWLRNRLLNRLDGPAVICANGTEQWWIEGECYTKEEFDKKVKKP